MEVIIVGAGGFGKEVAFLIDRLQQINLLGFVDNAYETLPSKILGYPIFGDLLYLQNYSNELAVVLAIANPDAKEKIYNNLSKNQNLHFPNIIDSTALIGPNTKIGIGNILMPYTTYTAECLIGNFNMINMHSTIGHDTNIGNFNSIFPNVNISGNVSVGSKNLLGVGTKIIQGITIKDEIITGAGSVVISDLSSRTKNVGVPTRQIESW